MTDRVKAWQVVAIVLLATLPYLNALADGFTLDDDPVILQNPAVIGGLDVGRAFAEPLFGRLYRPVTVLTYALNQALYPGQAWFFHATNIVLHAVVSVLVFFLAHRLFGSVVAALPAAVLFAVHPIHTEAVTSIVGRAELLAALFSLVALLSAWAAEAGQRRSRRGFLRVTSVLAFPLAVLSKESAASVLPLLLYVRVVARQESLSSGLRRELRSGDWLVYGSCLVGVVLLRHFVLGGWHQGGGGATGFVPLSQLDNALAFVPALDRIRSAVAILWDYFGLLNVPIVLSADYSFDQVPIIRSWTDPGWLAGAAVLLAGLFAMVMHPRPAVRFAVATMLLTLLVTANLLFPIGTIKGERLLYLPSIGWALLAGAGIAALRQHQRYARPVMMSLGVVVLGFAARTWQRNWDWRDNWTLYQSMVDTAPRSAKARNNLGVALQQRGLDAAAVEQFQAALAIYPETEAAALGIGIAREREGRIDEAEHWLGRAIAIRPEFVLAHGYRCAYRLRAGDYAAAGAACRAGLRHQPANPELLKGLGFSFLGLADQERGTAVLRRVLALNPQDEEARAYLSRLAAESRGVSETNG